MLLHRGVRVDPNRNRPIAEEIIDIMYQLKHVGIGAETQADNSIAHNRSGDDNYENPRLLIIQTKNQSLEISLTPEKEPVQVTVGTNWKSDYDSKKNNSRRCYEISPSPAGDRGSDDSGSDKSDESES